MAAKYPDDDEDELFIGTVAEILQLHDTMPMAIPVRAQTSSEWPPPPPLPADLDLAQGTVDNAVPVRNASIFAAVSRPPTSSDTDD